MLKDPGGDPVELRVHPADQGLELFELRDQFGRIVARLDLEDLLVFRSGHVFLVVEQLFEHLLAGSEARELDLDVAVHFQAGQEDQGLGQIQDP